MARPVKDGVDYFPVDCHPDDNLKLIEAEFGLKGFAVIVKLWQKIYGGQGYYCEFTKEVALLFGHECGLGGTAVSEIVSAAISRGLFDKNLYDKYQILTSRGIQKRYFEAVSRRKSISVKNQYLLVNVDQNLYNVDINPENVDINPENVDRSTQRKEKKTKVNNTIIPESLRADFDDFEMMRRKINKPLTNKAQQMITEKLERLAPGNISLQQRILQQSVLHCWQDVYAIKTDNDSADKNNTFDIDSFFTAAVERGRNK